MIGANQNFLRSFINPQRSIIVNLTLVWSLSMISDRDFTIHPVTRCTIIPSSAHRVLAHKGKANAQINRSLDHPAWQYWDLCYCRFDVQTDKI